ncbi:uncharacterized protein ACIBXB_011224 isoform 3-T3 [Morphnus guianensis]
MSAVMLPSGNEDAELHRLTQEGALPQRRVVCRKLEPFHVSLIIFLGRAWDAVTDPAVGFLVSKSPRRKYGKLVPWIACSMPFGVLCYCMMWSTLSDATPTSLKFLWYLLMYSFFQTCMTCHHVPYSSLTMFLGGTQRDRDSATAYRMGMEVFSTLLGSGIQGQIVGSYHARMMNSCYVSNETQPNTSTYSLTDSLENIRRAYVFASLVLGSIYCLSCLILIFGVREEPGPLSPLGKVELPFASCLRMIVGHKPYIQLLCGFLFASLAFQVRDLPWQEESLGDEMSGQVIQTVNLGPPARNISMLLSQITQGIFAFFCTHAAGLAGKFQHLVLIMLVSEPQAELPHGGVDPWVTPALEHEQLSLIESCAAVSAHQQGHHPDRDSPLVHSSGHSFPLCSLLAVVFGEIRKENSSVTGPSADHPSPGSHHPGDAQLPGLRLPGDRGRLQHGCALPFTMVHAARYGGRLHAEEPQLPQPGGSLLLVLRLLQQVCRWPCHGGIDAEFTTSGTVRQPRINPGLKWVSSSGRTRICCAVRMCCCQGKSSLPVVFCSLSQRPVLHPDPFPLPAGRHGTGRGSCCSPSPATSPELLSPGLGLASLLAGPDRSGQGRSMLSFWERLQCQGGRAHASPRAVLTHTGVWRCHLTLWESMHKEHRDCF